MDDIAAAFEKFDLTGSEPAWSSWTLEQLSEATLSRPGVTIADLFRGFDLALKRNGVELTEVVANLVKDVALIGFTRHKAAFALAEWDWANEELAKGVSAPRAYFFLRALPPDRTTPASLLSILRSLEGSARFQEAVHVLEDDFERADVKRELRRWRADGMGSPTAEALHSFL
ncbi:MAG: hypothetical protein ACRC33_04125 [Gemmataceae bacterium]